MAKYEFTGETEQFSGRTLHRIRAIVEIASLDIAVGQLGGWIEKTDNLAQVSGDAWVYGDAEQL